MNPNSSMAKLTKESELVLQHEERKQDAFLMSQLGIPIETDWIQIFTASTVPQLRFIEGKPVVVQVTVDELAVTEIANNYDAKWQMACLWVGHDDPTQKALAWVSQLKAEGGKLFAKFTHISPELLELINSKKYLYVSVELYNYKRDGRELRYLGAIALTNLPLILGLPQLDFSTIGKIAASRTFEEAIQCENNIQEFFENLNENPTMDLKDTSIGKFGANIGLRVSDYGTEQSVLDAAADIINKLRAKFTDPNEQPCSLDMFLAKCDNKLARIPALETEVKEANDKVSKAEDEKIEFVVKAGIESGKILPAQEADMKASLKADFKSGINLLSSMKPSGILASNTLNNSAPSGTESGSTEDREKWDFEKWSKEDSNGLADMKASNPERFNKLFESTYGK